MRNDVVLVPFPFDDLSGSKVRPAVCLTDSIGAHRHTILAFISSAVPNPLDPSDMLLDPADPAFSQSGLKIRSVLRLHRVVTVSSPIIQRRLGSLSPAYVAGVQQRLRALLKV